MRYQSPTKRLRVFIATLLLCVSSVVTAADLGQLKAKGMIGERLDGFLQLMNPSAPKDVQDLVKNINAQRRAAYAKIAQQNKVSVAQVGKLTAPKAMASSPPGTPIQTAKGWTKKK